MSYILTVPGGHIKAAMEVADLILSHKLDTYVNGMCASACTIAFLAGHQRFVSETGRLGFHQAHGPGISIEQSNLLLQLAYQNFALPPAFTGCAGRSYYLGQIRRQWPQQLDDDALLVLQVWWFAGCHARQIPGLRQRSGRPRHDPHQVHLRGQQRPVDCGRILLVSARMGSGGGPDGTNLLQISYARQRPCRMIGGDRAVPSRAAQST